MQTPTSSGRWLLLRGSTYATVTAAQGVALAVTLPLLTRLLQPGELGVVAAALIVYRIVALIGGLGLPAAVGRDYFEDDGPRLASVLVAWSVGFIGVVALLVEVAGPAWTSMFASIAYGQPLRLAVWTGAVTAIARTVLAYLRAADRAGPFVVVSLVGGPGAYLTGVLAIALIRPAPAVFLWGFFGAACVSAAVALAYVPTPRPRTAHIELVRAGIRYGLPTVPHLGAMMVLVLGDRVLVERILGVDELGRYEVAYVLGAIGIQLLLAMTNAWTPMIFGVGDHERWSVLSDTTDLVQRLSRWVAAGLAVGAPIGLLLVAPDSYDPARLGPVVAVVAGTMPFYVWYAATSIVLQQRRRTAIFYWAAPLAAAFNLALNFALIPAFGLVGAAVATLLAYALLGAITAWGARRHATIRWHPRSLRTSLMVVGIAVVGSVIAPSSPTWLWLRGFVAVAILWHLLRIVQTALQPRPTGVS